MPSCFFMNFNYFMYLFLLCCFFCVSRSCSFSLSLFIVFFFRIQSFFRFVLSRFSHLYSSHLDGRNKALVSRRMMRMIVGVGLFQLIVMLVLVFAGDKIFNVPSGRNQDGGEDPSVHYTIVFTAFVIMTIFNQINARKIHDELNVFENFFNNWIFVGILVGEFVAQVPTYSFLLFSFDTLRE